MAIVSYEEYTRGVEKPVLIDLPALESVAIYDLINVIKSEYKKKKDFYNKINNYAVKSVEGANVIFPYEGFDLFKKAFDHIEKNVSLYHPSLDGVTHINVYSKAATQLGRMLSNFFHAPIELKDDGNFNSVEGYWYWLKTGDDRLRRASGYTAKKLGRDILKSMEANGIKPRHIPDFDEKIKNAITIKLETHAKIREALINSNLPLTHYYFYGKIPNVNIHTLKQYDWIMDHISDLRSAYQNDKNKQADMKNVLPEDIPTVTHEFQP